MKAGKLPLPARFPEIPRFVRVDAGRSDLISSRVADLTELS
jgi:hypothetical protein